MGVRGNLGMKKPKSKALRVRSAGTPGKKTQAKKPKLSTRVKMSAKAKRNIAKQEEELDAQHAKLGERDCKCQCGRVATQEPLAMCESCPVCDVMMHTVADQKKHAKCIITAEQQSQLEAEEAASVPAEKSVPKQRRSEEFTLPPTTEESIEKWETFFQCQRNPVLRSQLLTALMAGTRLEVERVPTALLLDLLILATACREQHEAEIVDSYRALLSRVEEEWKRPDWTCKVFSSTHANLASFIVQTWASDFYPHEVRYIPALAGWLLEHETPEYFSEELTEAPKKSLLGVAAARKRNAAVAAQAKTAKTRRRKAA